MLTALREHAGNFKFFDMLTQSGKHGTRTRFRTACVFEGSAMRACFALLLTAAVLPAADVDVLLPVEVDQITYVNVRQITASPLIKNHVMKELKEKLKATPVTKWLEEMGID